MASLSGDPKPGYTVSLFISKKTEPHSIKEGQYDTREFPGQTIELARAEFRGASWRPSSRRPRRPSTSRLTNHRRGRHPHHNQHHPLQGEATMARKKTITLIEQLDAKVEELDVLEATRGQEAEELAAFAAQASSAAKTAGDHSDAVYHARAILAEAGVTL